jgi:hypothetical protein
MNKLLSDKNMKCTKCEIEMIRTSQLFSSDQVRDFFFCPKCNVETKGAVVSGVIHEEINFFVEVKWQGQLSIEQLKVIRLLSENYGNLALGKAVSELKNKESIRLGPYWPKSEAQKVISSLNNENLKASLSV